MRTLQTKRRFSRLLPIGCVLLLLCSVPGYGLLGLIPKPPLLEGVSFGRIVLAQDGGIVKISLSSDQKYRLQVALGEIAPEASRALLQYEDRYFYSHPGINPYSLLRAAASSLFGKGRRLGASTLTMQVARLRYHLKTSDLAGKLQQIWLALLIERHYSKQEILEAYFNLAPYGGNIEGIEAASRIYFNKPAGRLTRSECRALAVVPQNPSARHPVKGPDFNTARGRLESLSADRTDRLGPPSETAPLYVRNPGQLPFIAPHLAMELLMTASDGSRLQTGIERDAQRILENAVRSFVDRGRRYGITNASALLVRCSTMQVCALVGSADFFDAAIAGQVDGTKAKRSPGSTLKPFIYALALDQGLVHPMSMLPDSPRSFGGYDPENFDKGFRGPLPAYEALKASRNLPAVFLTERLKTPGLYGFLQSAGIKFDHGPEHYGLALALGGAEVTMRDLAALYAMLANQGLWQPVRLNENAPRQAPQRLLSPEAAFLTLWMLEREEAVIRSRNGRVPVRYKTGTSNGLRDAWTAGIVGDYVLVVWVGNFDNRSNPYFVGAQTALPLFMETARALGAVRHLTDRQKEPASGLNLAKTPVCAATGDLEIAHCSRTSETWFIPGVSPIRKSGILRPILLDRATGMRACQAEAGKTEEVWWEFWPTDMRRIFAQAGIHKPLPPQRLPECRKEAPQEQSGNGGKTPRIILPKKNVTYQRKLSDPGTELPLLAAAEPDVQRIHWYVDARYLGSAEPGEILFWKPRSGGKVNILAVDDHGRSAGQACRILAVP